MSEYQQDTTVKEGAEKRRSLSWRSRLGRRLARNRFASAAIADRADLSAFRGPPPMSVIIGVSAICLSFVICWPAITALGVFSVYTRRPWIVVLGGPVLYGLSHLCFMGGMLLSGEKYTRILLRWAARVGIEKLLAKDGVE